MSVLKPPIVCADDKKAHSKTVADAWAEYDIKVWPGAGQVYDRTLISDFTGEDGEKLGGYLVNSPDAMIQDQSVNNTLKNFVGGLYDTFSKWKPSRQIMDGFMNAIHSSFENLSQEQIQNTIDIQQKIMEKLLLHRGLYELHDQWICDRRRMIFMRKFQLILIRKKSVLLGNGFQFLLS